jgi:hypothetical protein
MSLLALWATVDSDSRAESFDPFDGNLLWCFSALSSAEQEFGLALVTNLKQHICAAQYDMQLLRAVLTFPANEGSNTKDPSSLLARMDDSLLNSAISVLAKLKGMDLKCDHVSLMGEFGQGYARAFVVLLSQFCCSWSVEFWDCVLPILNIMPCHGVALANLDQPLGDSPAVVPNYHPSVSRRRSSSGSVQELDMDEFLNGC